MDFIDEICLVFTMKTFKWYVKYCTGLHYVYFLQIWSLEL